mmetsp:Transcript_13396/g.39131  ORF Transcript_13396/g.39131 Transcript_13396/m.39131 type:complete len:240 (+) Transcript_13396:192-911(+)
MGHCTNSCALLPASLRQHGQGGPEKRLKKNNHFALLRKKTELLKEKFRSREMPLAWLRVLIVCRSAGASLAPGASSRSGGARALASTSPQRRFRKKPCSRSCPAPLGKPRRWARSPRSRARQKSAAGSEAPCGAGRRPVGSGKLPESMQKVATPSCQQSRSLPYTSPRWNSGGYITAGDPAPNKNDGRCPWGDRFVFAIPKSASFKWPSEAMSMFSSFTSRWIVSWSCKWCRARQASAT